MMPCTQSTFSCCTSLLKRSMVSLGEDSSSMISSILRPAMPPLALNRSAAHCAARMPFSPGAAAIPDLGARIPMRTGLFCAIAGMRTPCAIANAPAAAADFRTVRREKAMVSSLVILSRSLPLAIGAFPKFESCRRPSGRGRRPRAKEGVDVIGRHRPVVVEIGDHLFHEGVRQADGAVLVAQVIEQDGKRELL